MHIAFREILRHEWRHTRLDRPLWVLAAGLVFAGGFALASGAVTVRGYTGMVESFAHRQAQRIAVLRESVGDRTVSWDAGDPGDVGFNRAPQWLMLPPAPLAGLALGQSDVLPAYYRVTVGAMEEVSAADDETENPDRLALGRFDMAFLIVQVLPMVILALTYNVVSGERERGTLPMLLVQPVRLGHLAVAKVTVRALVILGAMAVVSLIGAAVGAVMVGPDRAMPAALLWVGVLGAYGAFWFAVALAVNAWGPNSRTNATILMSLWILLVVVVPTALNLVASHLHPVPSRMLFTTAIREATDAAESEGAELLDKYYGEHPELLLEADRSDLQEFYVTRFAVAEAVREASDSVRSDFAHQVARQRTVVDRYRYLSPALLAHTALTDIAGTGIPRHARFEQQVRRFERTWSDDLGQRILGGERLARDDYDRLPRFRFAEEPMARLSGRVAAAILGMLVPTALLGGLSRAGLRRYRVR